jgi:hypothetical protein
MSGHVPSLALVLLRVPRGAAPPADERVQRAIDDDRRRLGLGPADDTSYRLAGPYPVEIEGQSLDEYVAWEV